MDKVFTPMIPSEIWYIILQYSISVPDFFDTHVTDRIPPWFIHQSYWTDSKQYWDAERTRNNLQRVCSSWDCFLRKFAHRFVRMADVVHRLVPVDHLRSAIRISFGDHQYLCCRKCHQYYGETLRTLDHKFPKLCVQIIHQIQPLKTEMLDLVGHSSGCGASMILPSAFPNLVAVQVMRSVTPTTEDIQLIEVFPSLRHSFSKCQWVPSTMGPLKSPLLTTLTLSLRIPEPSLHMLTYDDLYLPALKHLHIEIYILDELREYDEPSWLPLVRLPLVRLIGKELRTLRVSSERGFSGDIPGEIWSICPKVEHLHLDGQRTTIPPPAAHPVHILSIPYWDILLGYPLHEYVPDWPGLRTVRMDYEWDIPLDSCQLERLDSRLRLEDAMGESYEEFILAG
ncbi:hypothetical protein CPB86DRAFT_213214 [Serendipita vermifera]|nr:hypothetical protein CPB86DRAFT_213214 [Serendipita vermifera]